jgi:ATP-dependent 26S proteasome regulatory subunit
MRVEIWRRLLPDRLPVGEDVDINRLAEEELTGGQIKNVVLNAARLALVRGARGPVTMGDFLEALGMEGASRFGGGRGRIGF